MRRLQYRQWRGPQLGQIQRIGETHEDNNQDGSIGADSIGWLLDRSGSDTQDRSSRMEAGFCGLLRRKVIHREGQQGLRKAISGLLCQRRSLQDWEGVSEASGHTDD